MMRSCTYARTSPEARRGLAVFEVRLVVVVMARAYAGDFDWRQERGFSRYWQRHSI